ncbi:MAG TPA: hypothetical protein VJ596_09920 [Gemmatimonadaceae bacterium]|nr:hypothetical protein [Gemmatimonadaceae bacterium]
MNILLLAEDSSSAEVEAALGALGADLAARTVVSSVAALDDGADVIGAADVIWVHAARRIPALSAPGAERLRSHTERGGGLLLTLLATPLVVPLGLERLPPNDCGRFVWHDDADPLPPATKDAMDDAAAMPRLRGMQGWGGHPLFDGLGRGTFVWSPTEGEEAASAIYVLPRWPVRGRVVAVERAVGRIAVERAVAWEYTALPGRVLCIGAHLHFSLGSAETSPHRDRLLANAVYMLGRRVPLAESWWPDPQAPALPVAAVEAMPTHLGAALPEVGTSMVLTSLGRDDDPFVLAGRRAAILGGERSGIAEIWTHPLCLVSGGVEVRIDGEEPLVRSVEISPDQVIRHLHTQSRYVEERIFVPEHLPSAVIEYRFRRLGGSRVDPAAPKIEVRTRVPLLMEPSIPSRVLHPLRTARSTAEGVEAVVVVGRDDRFRAMLNVEGRASVSVVEDGQAVRVAIVGSLAEPLRVTVIGTVAGRTGVARVVRTMSRSGVRYLAASRAERTRVLGDDYVSLRSPSASLDAALEWAKVRLSSHVATAPGVGTASLAGYPARVWNAEQPRSECCLFRSDRLEWSGLGLLASGSFAEAQSLLEFLAQWQDIRGQMPRHVSTAGVADYLADRGCPTFLTLLAAFTRWTGDLVTVRRLWPHALRVLERLGRRPGATDVRGTVMSHHLAVLEEAVADAWTRGAGVESATPSHSFSPLADFAAHRGEQGFRHLLAHSLSCFEGAKGAFAAPDAARSLAHASSCPDDASGSAMVVRGIVEGMWGIRPDATGRRVHVTPHCPREWTDASLRRLRVGEALLEMDATEGCMVGGAAHDGVSYRLRVRPPGALTLVLEHPVGGRSFERVLADGEELHAVRCGTPECPHVRVTMWLPRGLEIQFVGDRLS